MQKFRMLQGQENVKNSREAINENFISVASNFASDAFPTSNLYVGMKFYHTGEQKTYTLRQLDPVRWDEDTPDRLKNARNISLTGKVQSEKIAFDGSADAIINVTRVEADVCNGNSATATVAFNVRGAISSQNAPRHVWFSGINNETQREYANNFVYNPVTGTLSVPRVEGTASISERSYTADKAGADGNGANIAATYAPKNGAGAYGTWGINIGGRAEVANVADRVGNDGASMRFHWNGQGGQPSWLWGGNNPNDAYVWNPSNFSVNHANTANFAGSANTAGRANTAGWADSAKRAESADNAKHADAANYTSGYAEKAKRADGAGYADNAKRAESAGWADGAQRAKSAERADAAGYADRAGYSNNAGTVGGKSVEQIRNESSRVAVLSGTINDGETIPLPDGYSEAQCKWLVSMRQRKYDGDETFAFDCYTNGRTVVCHFFVSGANHLIVRPAIANYIVIGVK